MSAVNTNPHELAARLLKRDAIVNWCAKTKITADMVSSAEQDVRDAICDCARVRKASQATWKLVIEALREREKGQAA